MNVLFLKPMECASVQNLPTIAGWTYEIKLDGYRLQAHRLADRVVLYSRRGNVKKFPEIAKELEQLPAGTILDGELAALDDQGRPRFNLLQNYRSGTAHLAYFVFDILLYKGRDTARLPLSERRHLLQSTMKRGEHVEMTEWSTDLKAIESFVKKHKLEGIIAKRSDGRYESGRRSGTWVKMRFSNRQEIVVGGYTPSHLGLDAVLVGFYVGKDLRFAGSVRAGFNPRTRREVHDQIKRLEVPQCPFTNLPDRRPGLWGQGITEAKMKECRWLRPTAVAEIEFAEWTPGDRLRGASFICLRDDKDARKVVKET